MISENTYRYDLDPLKCLAIITVVLYHAGWFKSGYLGVYVFLVLNGYLVVPKVMNEIESGQFRYFGFLETKLFRFPFGTPCNCQMIDMSYSHFNKNS